MNNILKTIGKYAPIALAGILAIVDAVEDNKKDDKIKELEGRISDLEQK